MSGQCNINLAIMECVQSLQRAIFIAGGDCFIDFENTSVRELIELIAPNNIRFVYKNGNESVS